MPQQWRQFREDARHLANAPAVPGPAVLRAAWAVLRESNYRNMQPAGSDALWLGAILDIQVYRAFVRHQANAVPANMLESESDIMSTVCTLAGRGSSEFTIGIAIDRGATGGTFAMHDIMFDAAPRRADWMGLCPSWPMVRDHDVHIMRTPLDQAEPAVVIAPRPGLATKDGQEDIPDSLSSRTLAALLSWHGAKRVRWHYADTLRFLDNEQSTPDVDLRDLRPATRPPTKGYEHILGPKPELFDPIHLRQFFRNAMFIEDGKTPEQVAELTSAPLNEVKDMLAQLRRAFEMMNEVDSTELSPCEVVLLDMTIRGPAIVSTMNREELLTIFSEEEADRVIQTHESLARKGLTQPAT